MVRYRLRKGGCALDERYITFFFYCKFLSKEANVSLLTYSYVPLYPGCLPFKTELSMSVPTVWMIASAWLIRYKCLCGSRMSPMSQSIYLFYGWLYFGPCLYDFELTYWELIRWLAAGLVWLRSSCLQSHYHQQLRYFCQLRTLY